MRALVGRRGRRALLGTAGVGLLALAGCDLGAAPTTYPVVGTEIETGDVNGDGHLDVLTGLGSSAAEVLLGDGAGAFSASSLSGSFTYPNRHGMALADANGDGFDDLFLSWRDHPPPPPEPCDDRPDRCPPPPVYPPVVYQVHLNNGGTEFGPATVVHSIPTSGESHFHTPWTVHDLDGDGHQDLVLTHATSVIARFGDGIGGFGAPTSTSSPVLALGELRFADLDADGHDDLVVAGAVNIADPNAAIAVHWGTGTAALGSPAVMPTIPPPPGERNGSGTAGIGDVDGDGDLDLLGAVCPIGSLSDDADLAVLRGDGARGFEPVLRRDWPEQACHGPGVADFDGDGTADVYEGRVVVDSETGEVVDRRAFVRWGDPDVTLSEAAFVATGPATVVDVDKDGRPDLLARTGDGLQVFLNRWEGRP